MKPCRFRSQVDRHFRGRMRPAGERALRMHLLGCEACRAHYDRWLLMVRLDPRAHEPSARLGRGLGFRPAVDRARLLGLCAVPALAAGLLVYARAAPAGFAARSTAPAAQASGAIRVFRVSGAAASEVASGAAIPAQGELAFAYQNPNRRPRLLVFAVDEHRHVYWYHPEWTDPATDPTAVAIAAEPGLHELPAAIAHPLDGGALAVRALFVDGPVHVREVESMLAHTRPGAKLPIPGAEEARIDLVVKR
jgi:hypothetical protein